MGKSSLCLEKLQYEYDCWVGARKIHLEAIKIQGSLQECLTSWRMDYKRHKTLIYVHALCVKVKTVEIALASGLPAWPSWVCLSSKFDCVSSREWMDESEMRCKLRDTHNRPFLGWCLQRRAIFMVWWRQWVNKVALFLFIQYHNGQWVGLLSDLIKNCSL